VSGTAGNGDPAGWIASSPAFAIARNCKSGHDTGRRRAPEEFLTGGLTCDEPRIGSRERSANRVRIRDELGERSELGPWLAVALLDASQFLVVTQFEQLMDVKQFKTLAVCIRIIVCVAAFCTLRLAADVVETASGARFVGKITRIHAGIVTIDTGDVGEINVKQTLVTSITTDHPVAVKVADGASIVGVVSPSPAGGIRITNAKGSFETPVAKVIASWVVGEEDPDLVALRRKWSYEAGADINGRTGTHTQAGTALMYRAKLTGPDDTFQYYANYLRQETDDQVSADQFKGGVDYADNFTPLRSWYVRDEGGFDRVNQITFFDVAASGYGYDFIKETGHVLTGRAGLSYRYDRYSTRNTPSLSSAGGDFEME
jgi:hypothetical protein